MAIYEFEAQSSSRKMVITEIALAPVRNRPVISTEESNKVQMKMPVPVIRT